MEQIVFVENITTAIKKRFHEAAIFSVKQLKKSVIEQKLESLDEKVYVWSSAKLTTATSMEDVNLVA